MAEKDEEPATSSNIFRPISRSRSSSSYTASQSVERGRTVSDVEKDTQLSATASGNDLSRTRSRQSVRESIISRIRTRPPFGQFSHPLSHTKTSSDVIVDFDGPDDPYRPLNWPHKKKVITTALYGLTTMGATWASAVYSPGVRQIAEDFHVSQEVATLGVSFLLFGFGVGPLIWAPLSEVYGRKLAVLVPYAIGICFTFGTATAKDIQTVLITRFFAGFFGSAPVTNTGGVLGDLFAPAQRGVALVGYAMAVVGGPVLGMSHHPSK